MDFLRRAIAVFQSHIKNRFVRYIFVGGLNTAFGYGLYCLLVWLGVPFIWATLVSHVLGVLFNFMTTGTLVFEDNDLRKIFKFFLNYVLTYFINIGINKALQVWLGCNEYIAGAGATIFTALVSFVILKRLVFSNHVSTNNEKD